jgi:type II secretory pathway pseudopilin PulG
VVVVIVAILASMLLPLYSSYKTRMEAVNCMANLRNLHIAASGYLLSNKSWPQISPALGNDNPKAFAKAWVEALRPFGAPHSTWICPAIQQRLHVTMEAVQKDEDYRIDYVPTPFDDNEVSPRRALRHPWFIEKAGFHGRGNLVILADGTTTSLKDLVDRTGGR